jgi:hypothetical protein
MNKGLSITCVLLVLFLCGCLPQPKDFSADIVNKSGRNISTGKVFISGDKIRTEMQGAVTITRTDKKVAWVIMPSEKAYFEQSLDPRFVAASSAGKSETEVERKFIGNENMEGRGVSKYRVDYSYQGTKESVYQWVASGIDFPIKTAAIDGSWYIEYKNIKTSKLADSLFEVPAGYKKFSQGTPSMKNILGAAAQSLF